MIHSIRLRCISNSETWMGSTKLRCRDTNLTSLQRNYVAFRYCSAVRLPKQSETQIKGIN